ncbi:ABC transporter substrate-binding protein [Cohnella sp. AR92]|uniref:ABC transporter substrate-binding protein n=1 Tax=Cohnella sp. AR92 TaxID=648716 RepID=UPI0013156A09|nr:extracellular solute-binding protein [Cohnella sp. AR92]
MIKQRQPIHDWLRSNPIDLIYLRSSQFAELIDHNDLIDLQPHIKRNSFPLESIIPSLMELTRQYGEGSIYGLPPSFYSEAVAINRDLFDSNNMRIPEGQTTWSGLMDAVRQADGGLSVHKDSPFLLLMRMGQSSRLQMFDENTREATIDTPAWKQIWELATAAVQNENIRLDPINDNPFLTGDRAAALLSYYDYKLLELTKPDFRWSLLPVPMDGTLLGMTTSLSPDGFWAIPAASANPDDAWKLVAFLMSDNVAKWNYRSDYGFSSLSQQFSISSVDKDELGAFYELQPLVPETLPWPDFLPDLVNGVFGDILSGSESVESGLKKLQDLVSQQAKENI